MPSYVSMSESTLSLERCPLCARVASPPPHLLVENLLGEGSPCHHHAAPRLGAAAWGGFHWSMYLNEKNQASLYDTCYACLSRRAVPWLKSSMLGGMGLPQMS